LGVGVSVRGVALITVTIPYPTPSGNVTLREHWRSLAQRKRWLAWKIRVKVLAAHPPLERAAITITRHGSRALDHDNLVAGCKALLDVLKPPGRSNPQGLGVIAGDEPHRLTVEYRQVRCKRKDEKTVVEIEAVQQQGDDNAIL
jgi:hypothetical protein